MANTALTLLIGADISLLRAELLKANGLMKGFSAQLAGLGAAMGVTFGAAAVFQGLRHGIQVIGDFSHSMQEVRAITNATGNEFEALRKNALELGRTTKFTAKEVAELQIAFGRLGFSNKEIIASTEATLQLAAATGEDLAKSADIAGSTLRSFNLDASEMQRVVDVMAASFNKSALGLDNFGEAMKYVAPVASAANISLEETTAMLGVLADSGIRGSMAGTSLRKIISDVKDESGTLSERLSKLAEKGFTGAEAMDEVGRTAYASLLVLTKHVDKVNEAAVAYQNVDGEAAKMAHTMEDDLWGDVTMLSSAMDGLILKFREGEGPLRELTQGLTELVQVMSDDKVIKFLKEWFNLVSIVPRKTLDAISWLRDVMSDDVDQFKVMQEKRRKIWEDTVKKTLEEEVKKTGEAEKAIKNYTATYRDLLSVVTFDTQQAFKTPSNEVNPFYHPDINMDPSAGLLSSDERSNPVPGVVKEIEYNKELSAQLAQLEVQRSKQMEQMQATAEMATTMGEAIGEAFNGMLSGTMNFAQGLAKVTEEIITMYLKQSIAATIAGAMKTGGPFPFVGVALAVAGIGAVKALFNQIGGSAGGGTSTGGAPGHRPSELNVNMRAKLKGSDILLAVDRANYRRDRLG